MHTISFLNCPPPSLSSKMCLISMGLPCLGHEGIVQVQLDIVSCPNWKLLVVKECQMFLPFAYKQAFHSSNSYDLQMLNWFLKFDLYFDAIHFNVESGVCQQDSVMWWGSQGILFFSIFINVCFTIEFNCCFDAVVMT